MKYTITEIDVAVYIGLVVLVNRIIAGMFTPVFDKLKLDKMPLMYVAWGLAAYIIFTTGFNLFESIIPDLMVGRILTSVAVGGGANILYDVSDNEPSNVYSGSNLIGSNPDARDH